METYEEKYKDLVKRLNKAREERGVYTFNSVLDAVAPELKIDESEDERIRKEIIDFVKSRGGFKGEWIAWLEKQGDKDKLIKELGEYKVKYTQEVLSQQLEKKAEQKPIDKVEPKFKVGDWVVYQNNTFQVQSLSNGTLILQGKKYQTYFIKELCRLWTIEDAKDGDVLVSADNIIIYGGYINNYGDRIGNKAILAYCGWNGEQLVINKKKKEGFGGIGYVPATKEQRDLLFQKMHEASFEWDADKKELKKIEKESTWNEKIKGLNELETYILSLVPDRSLDAIKVDAKNIRYIINKEQKPWSKEDDSHIHNIIGFLEECKSYNPTSENTRVANFEINWLKSIRPQNHWEPSDEQIVALECAVNDVQRFSSKSLTLQVENEPYYKNLVSLLKQLKKLREG